LGIVAKIRLRESRGNVKAEFFVNQRPLPEIHAIVARNSRIRCLKFTVPLPEIHMLQKHYMLRKK